MGLPAGAAAFLVPAALAPRAAGSGRRIARRCSPAFAALGAATGAGFRSQIGTTHNDLLTAVPLLAALLLALRAAVLSPRPAAAGRHHARARRIAGRRGGRPQASPTRPFAAGLGGALAAALRAGGRPLARPLGLLLGGGALGFALAAGPWMLRLWQEWGNPFFPFFDTLFAAGRPSAPVGRDPRFLPQGALEWLFFPFTWALSDAPRSSEMEMRDPRVALAFLALVALALGARRCLARPAVAFLAAFLLLSYLLWLLVFSIYRYAVLIEMLSSLLALLAVAAFSPQRRTALLAVLLVAGSVAATDPPAWGRAPHGPRYLDAALPELPAGALLLLGRDEPLAYLAAVAPAGTRLVGLSALAQFGPRSPFADDLREALAEASPIYLLVPELEGAADAAAGWGLRTETGACRRVCTNWTSGGLGPLVCPAANAEFGAFPPAPIHRGPHANTLCGMAGAGLTLGGRRRAAAGTPEGALLWPPAELPPAAPRRRGRRRGSRASPRTPRSSAPERSEAALRAAAGPRAGRWTLRSRAGAFHLTPLLSAGGKRPARMFTWMEGSSSSGGGELRVARLAHGHELLLRHAVLHVRVARPLLGDGALPGEAIAARRLVVVAR